MGELSRDVSRICDDLKHSWYFRVWVLLAAVCAVMSLVALISLAAGAASPAVTDGDMVYRVHESTIAFPNIRFQLKSKDSFTSWSCTHNNAVVPAQLGFTTTSVYLDVDASKVEAQYGDSCAFTIGSSARDCGERLECTLVTNAAAGELLYLAINNGHDSAVGNPLADYIGGSWIAPNNMSWVLLDKQVINDAEEWNMDLIYHSTDVVPGIYKVTVIIASSIVTYWDSGDWESAWMLCGIFGGWLYFMYFLHTAAMCLVGVCMDNDSTYLQRADVFSGAPRASTDEYVRTSPFGSMRGATTGGRVSGRRRGAGAKTSTGLVGARGGSSATAGAADAGVTYTGL